jgi:hypothetical protein
MENSSSKRAPFLGKKKLASMVVFDMFYRYPAGLSAISLAYG